MERVAATVSHPSVIRCGVTCTENGQWALYLGVADGVKLPIMEIENLGFPTVYVIEPDQPIRIQGNVYERPR
jgi:hypothetical protein